MTLKERARLISRNLSHVREKIKTAAESSGRDSDDIDLMVVTKTWPAGIIEIVVDNGIRLLGENRIQEALPKIENLAKNYSDLHWHMIGHLQSNKAKYALDAFDCIQSVDSLKIANRISSLAVQRETRKDIMLEVNISGESSKFGFKPEEVMSNIETLLGLPGINLTGLMTIGPLTGDREKIRKAFREMKKLYNRLSISYPNSMKNLSMGMSDDYDIAIEEGATMVRIGRAIFGPREI